MGIYYVGYRESDIAIDFNANETDPFFSGSITCFGSNENGNVSYNVISGMQFNESLYTTRNDAIYTKFISEQCNKIVEKDSDAKFLPYSVYFASKIPDELKSRSICCNDERILGYLNSKINFKKFVAGDIPQAPYTLKKGHEILEQVENGMLVAEREVVVQAEFGAGGEGTYLCTRKNLDDDNFKDKLRREIKPKDTYIVSDFVENLCSVAIHVQVSDDEIGIYPPSVQIMNGPHYVGGDIYEFSQLDEEVKQECLQVARKFGEKLRDMKTLQIKKEKLQDIKNRGYFGLDAIIAKTGTPRVFVVETNPRFTGTVGLLNILCNKAGIGSVYEHSYKCFSGEPLNTDDFKKITPNGRKRYAKVERDSDGVVRSLEGENRNQEGLDKTVFQENFLYTHVVFEEVKKFNIYDDRLKYKKYMAKTVRKCKK